jgi:hypothetical protein
MAGASAQTKRVVTVNGNWEAGPEGGDGTFRFMLVTEDEQRHFISPSPAAAATLAALFRRDAVLLWDPINQVVIMGGLVGTWSD